MGQGGRDHTGSPVPTSLPKQGHPRAQGCVQRVLESLVREAPHPPQSSLELQVLSDAQALPVPDSKSKSRCQAVRV